MGKEALRQEFGRMREQHPEMDSMIAQVKTTARADIILITCPECAHSVLVADNGWTAILCQGCRGTLYRDALSAKEDT